MVSLGALPVLGLAEVSVSRSVPLIRGLLAALGYDSLLNTLKGEKGNIGHSCSSLAGASAWDRRRLAHSLQHT